MAEDPGGRRTRARRRPGAARQRPRRGARAAWKPGAFRLRDEEIEAALRSGRRSQELKEYFGEAAFEELNDLSRRAARRAPRGAPRVLILPGILGSRLGRRRALLDDLIWIDPFDIALGRMTDLALDARRGGIEALGVLLFTYLKLKLTLAGAGYEADFHPYDWRLDIPGLGRRLSERLDGEAPKPVHLVAHSMGGLVARAALKAGARNVGRIVMLGTPNFGSFAVPQSLRGVYPVVRKVAALDLRHSPEVLASRVFATFPGLYQMMPWRDKFDAVDLYDVRTWPASGPRPRADLLRGIRAAQAALAGADERFTLIAGVNQDTVTDMSVADGEFVYRTSKDGDGTVPLFFAQIPNVPTYFVDESHGSLPNNGDVGRAVLDLLAGSVPRGLAATWAPGRGAPRRTLRERDLRVDPGGKRRLEDLGPDGLRHLVEEVAAPPRGRERPATPATTATAPPPGVAPRFDEIVVGRRRQGRLDLSLVRGNVADVDARAIVLGIFQGVRPAGAAAALDRRLRGAITEFTDRRMFSGAVGDMFLVPAGRSLLRADMVLLAGMGLFDRFSGEVQQVVAENVMRIFTRTYIEDFATVLFGGGTSAAVDGALASMLSGFLRGLESADVRQRFRRIVFCELDAERYKEMRRALYDLAGTDLFRDVEVTIDEPEPPAAIEIREADATRETAPRAECVYLLVRQESGAGPGGEAARLRVAVLGAGGKAAILSEETSVSRGALDGALAPIDRQALAFSGLPAYGRSLARLVVPDGIRAALLTMRDRHVVLVHDAPSSRIPWETIHLDGWSPALEAGMTRRYLSGDLSVAKWLESRRQDPILDLLLVVNPTGDLDGANAEGDRIRTILGRERSVRILELRGPQASRAALLRALRSGRHDVLHFAGHAFFDPAVPAHSGILCHNREVLTGADLAGLGNLPSLVFANACESGRLRARAAPSRGRGRIIDRLHATVSFAEAFLRGGVANYLGTYWPVGDDSATVFSTTFYRTLIEGRTLSAALQEGRRALAARRAVDWADYIFYGSPDFTLKQQ